MAHAAGALPNPDTLESYFNQIKDHELLTRDQEKMLARQYQRADDYHAADRLVRANLRLVVKIAREYYSGSGALALSDLIQEGNLGLVHAVRKFDPDKQTKFSYYASFWIKAFIFKYLMDNYRSVKIGKTQAQRKLFFNLRKTKEKLRQMGIPATPERIARRVGVKASEVEEMEIRMGFEDQSLNEPSRTRSQEQLLDNLTGQNQSAEQTVAKRQMTLMVQNILVKFKSLLDQRELKILELRIVAEEPMTLQTLGDRFGVSRERIRQIEANIIRKLRDYIQSELPDFKNYLVG